MKLNSLLAACPEILFYILSTLPFSSFFGILEVPVSLSHEVSWLFGTILNYSFFLGALYCCHGYFEITP